MSEETAGMFRALKKERKRYRASLPVCPMCFQRNPGGATKMHRSERGEWCCHYCKYIEQKEQPNDF